VGAIWFVDWILHDIQIYEGWQASFQSGGFPVGDPTWQYPPGAGLFLALPGLAPTPYLPTFIALVVAVDAVLMGILVAAFRRSATPDAFGLRIWAWAGLIVGPIMFVRFDVLPTLLAVGAVLLAARPAWSGVMAGLGFLVKVWPAAVLVALPRRRLPTGLAGFGAALVVVLTAVMLTMDHAGSFLANQASRGLQAESTGALPYWIWRMLGGDVANGLEYGAIQVQMAGAEAVGSVVQIAGLVMIGIIAFWRLSGRLEHAAGGDVALLVVLVLVVSSRVYSPQFNVWLVGLAAAAALTTESRLRRVVVLVIAVSIATQLVYPLFSTQLTDGFFLIVLVQAFRIVGLLAAIALAVRALHPSRSAQSATAAAAATLSESTPPDIGTRTTRSAD
jgi:hypothetical protein